MTLTFNMAVFFILDYIEETADVFERKNGWGAVSFCLYSPYRCKKGGNAGFFKG